MINGVWKVGPGTTHRIFSTINIATTNPPIPRIFSRVHVVVTVLAGKGAEIFFNLLSEDFIFSAP